MQLDRLKATGIEVFRHLKAVDASLEKNEVILISVSEVMSGYLA
jgi:hypothetical protein